MFLSLSLSRLHSKSGNYDYSRRRWSRPAWPRLRRPWRARESFKKKKVRGRRKRKASEKEISTTFLRRALERAERKEKKKKKAMPLAYTAAAVKVRMARIFSFSSFALSDRHRFSEHAEASRTSICRFPKGERNREWKRKKTRHSPPIDFPMPLSFSKKKTLAFAPHSRRSRRSSRGTRRYASSSWTFWMPRGSW